MSNFQNRTTPSQQIQVKAVAREFRFPFVPVVAMLGLLCATAMAFSVALGLGS